MINDNLDLEPKFKIIFKVNYCKESHFSSTKYYLDCEIDFII